MRGKGSRGGKALSAHGEGSGESEDMRGSEGSGERCEGRDGLTAVRGMGRGRNGGV